MFGEISVWAWMGLVIVFAFGGVSGFFISRQMKDERTLKLEEKLAATSSELTEYRTEVNQHFLKTSLLVSKLTNDYREVYEHLATGAQKLCNEKPGTPKLDLPDTKILPAVEATEEELIADGLQSDLNIDASSETAIESQEAADKLGEISGDSYEQQMHAESDEMQSTDDLSTATDTVDNKNSETPEHISAMEADKPAPEDIPDRDEVDDDIPLGAESATPGLDTEPHKTHPSIH